MKNIIFFLLIILNITLFAQKGEPDWVRNRPVDDNYYIGIGVAETNSKNYIEVATQNALNNLINEIITIVKSESELHKEEKETSFSEKYKLDISTSSKAIIKDYETVDTYNRKGYYWVYLRVSKSEYYKYRNKVFIDKYNLALENKEKAVKASNEGILSQIQYNLKVCENLEYYVYPNFEIIDTKESHKLYDEALNEIRILLNKISYKKDNDSITYNPKNNEELYSINIQVVDFEKKILHGGIPIALEYKKNEIELLDTIILCNINGVGGTKIKKINPLIKASRVKAMLDLNSILSGYEKFNFYNKIKSYPLPYKLINIFIEDFKFCVTKKYNSDNQNIIIGKLNELLISNGFNISNDNCTFSVVIETEINSNNNSDVFFSYLNVNISLKDTYNNKIIASKYYNSIKGAGLNKNASIVSAYNKFIEKHLIDIEFIKTSLK